MAPIPTFPHDCVAGEGVYCSFPRLCRGKVGMGAGVPPTLTLYQHRTKFLLLPFVTHSAERASAARSTTHPA